MPVGAAAISDVETANSRSEQINKAAGYTIAIVQSHPCLDDRAALHLVIGGKEERAVIAVANASATPSLMVRHKLTN